MSKHNYRNQISERIETLSILYSKIDTCFHQHFRLIDKSGTGILMTKDCNYEVVASEARKFNTWKKEFKAELSDILELIANHKCSIFDSEYKKGIDESNRVKVMELSQDYDNLIELMEKIHVVEI